MLGRILCALGFHKWGYFSVVLGKKPIIRSETRRICWRTFCAKEEAYRWTGLEHEWVSQSGLEDLEGVE